MMRAMPELNAKKALFTLPPAISNELDIVAKKLHKRKSHVVTEALEMYFDYLDLQAARERVASIKSKQEGTIKLDEMLAENGLK